MHQQLQPYALWLIPGDSAINFGKSYSDWMCLVDIDLLKLYKPQ